MTTVNGSQYMSDYQNNMSVNLQFSLEQVNNFLKESNIGNIHDLLMDGKPSGALVRPGEYVLYTEYEFLPDAHRSLLLVSQVINIEDLRDVRKELYGLGKKFWRPGCIDYPCSTNLERFILVSQMKLVIQSFIFNKPSAEDYPCVSKSLKEEVQRTAIVHWVDVRYMQSIAFVFHIDQVNECPYACAGIFNAFFIRYKVEHDTTINAITADEFNPFFMPHCLESYSK
jgi:hypothetical protein